MILGASKLADYFNRTRINFEFVSNAPMTLSKNIPEIRIHYSMSAVPSACPDANPITERDPRAIAGACKTKIGNHYKTFEDWSYTKGHTKCDIYVNMAKTNALTVGANAHTLIHKIGYCPGLAHESRSTETMHAYNYCTATTVQNFDSSSYCRGSTKFKLAVEDGYEGFYALPQDHPCTVSSSGRIRGINWQPYSSGYNERLYSGAKPNEKRTEDDSRTCRAQVQYLAGTLFPTWTNTSLLGYTCHSNPCRVICI